MKTLLSSSLNHCSAFWENSRGIVPTGVKRQWICSGMQHGRVSCQQLPLYAVVYQYVPPHQMGLLQLVFSVRCRTVLCHLHFLCRITSSLGIRTRQRDSLTHTCQNTTSPLRCTSECASLIDHYSAVKSLLGSHTMLIAEAHHSGIDERIELCRRADRGMYP